MRVRHQIAIWIALTVGGIIASMTLGPMYANHYWPEELKGMFGAPNAALDFDKMMQGFQKAKPIADTANTITLICNLFTAVAIGGLFYTSFRHFRKRKASEQINGLSTDATPTTRDN